MPYGLDCQLISPLFKVFRGVLALMKCALSMFTHRVKSVGDTSKDYSNKNKKEYMPMDWSIKFLPCRTGDRSITGMPNHLTILRLAAHSETSLFCPMG